MPSVLVSVDGGNSAFSDSAGAFTIPHAGASPVLVTSDVSSGQWVDVNNVAGSDLGASATLTPGISGGLTFNESPSEFETAQTNALLQVDLIHDYIMDRAPTFPGINEFGPIPCNVNNTGQCGACFNSVDVTLNFRSAGNNCVNTAYSTIIAHEYGHFVVDRLGLIQSSFGEGYGEACAILLHDTPISGEHYYQSGAHNRDYSTMAPRCYPCDTTSPHECGETLAGIVNEMRIAFKAKHGDTLGLELIRQLHVDWSLTTIGGNVWESAHPATAIEFLVTDDDDQNYWNGTPNSGIICQAFRSRGIRCPHIDFVTFAFPDGLPSTVHPGGSAMFAVDVSDGIGTAASGTGTVSYRVDASEKYTTAPMTEVSANSYDATIAGGVSCGDVVQYFVSAQDTDSNITDSPATGATFSYVVPTADSHTVILVEDFEADGGWTVENVSLTDGEWTRGVPAGGGVRGDPLTDFDGSGACWLTDNVAGNSDVDGGPTRLLSPVFDLTGSAQVFVSYAGWFSNDDDDVDRLAVEVSTDGGTMWTEVQSTGNTSGWVVLGFVVQNPGSQFRVRFNATDNPNDSVTEAAIDDFRIIDIECIDCIADWNADGLVNSADLLAYINDRNAALAGNLPIYGDPDLVEPFGVLNTSDFLEFLNQYNAGCP